jgi:hypothetical protein
VVATRVAIGRLVRGASASYIRRHSDRKSPDRKTRPVARKPRKPGRNRGQNSRATPLRALSMVEGSSGNRTNPTPSNAASRRPSGLARDVDTSPGAPSCPSHHPHGFGVPHRGMKISPGPTCASRCAIFIANLSGLFGSRTSFLTPSITALRAYPWRQGRLPDRSCLRRGGGRSPRGHRRPADDRCIRHRRRGRRPIPGRRAPGPGSGRQGPSTVAGRGVRIHPRCPGTPNDRSPGRRGSASPRTNLPGLS